MDTHEKYVIISWVTCVFAVCLFAALAMGLYTWMYVRGGLKESTEHFLTARHTASVWRVAWSYFAGAVGAWVIVGPSSFAVYTGVIGMVMYSISSGFPVIIVAFCGEYIQSKHPNVLSITDFVSYRYGPTVKALVCAICVFNMSIALLAEYTTMASLFADFVGTVDYPIVIIVGVVTMIYTAYGGLLLSMITDQAQAFLVIVLAILLTIYVAITFRVPLPALPPELAPNSTGYSTIYSMPCSLMAASVFSEAVWQRAWAGQDKFSVRVGSIIGCAMIVCIVFLSGFAGFLSYWAGLISWENTNPNLYLFQVFAAQNDDWSTYSTQVNSWIGVLTLIGAIVMNESAVDSLQTGITTALSSHFFKKQHVIFARIVVILINIPLIVVACKKYQVLALFLITNTLCSCAFLPIMLGLWDRGRHFISETSVVFAFCVAVLTVTAYGIGRAWNEVPNPISYGAWYTWYGNVSYSWDYFLVASGFSIVGLAMWIIPAQLIKALTGWEGPGISKVLYHIPGFKYLAGDGFDKDFLSYPCMKPVCKWLDYDPENKDTPSAAVQLSPDMPEPCKNDNYDQEKGVGLTPLDADNRGADPGVVADKWSVVE